MRRLTIMYCSLIQRNTIKVQKILCLPVKYVFLKLLVHWQNNNTFAKTPPQAGWRHSVSHHNTSTDERVPFDCTLWSFGTPISNALSAAQVLPQIISLRDLVEQPLSWLISSWTQLIVACTEVIAYSAQASGTKHELNAKGCRVTRVTHVCANPPLFLPHKRTIGKKKENKCSQGKGQLGQAYQQIRGTSGLRSGTVASAGYGYSLTKVRENIFREVVTWFSLLQDASVTFFFSKRGHRIPRC